MRKSLMSTQRPLPTPAQAFTLPGLLPPGACIFLDQRGRTATLLLPGGETGMLLYTVPLAPSALQVFHLLLQAYPGHCTYQQLFQRLYPTHSGQLSWNAAMGKRPVRRALFSLTPTLHVFGLKSIALRSLGYQLIAAQEGAWHPGGDQEQEPLFRRQSRLPARPVERICTVH